MKFKLVEAKEDDPIFKSGFKFSAMRSQSPKKTSESLNKKRKIKKKVVMELPELIQRHLLY